MDEEAILRVHDLCKYFPLERGVRALATRKPRRYVRAVDGVSFTVQRGEILALVGESGSGKTTVGMNVLGLQQPTQGRILLEGYDVSEWARGHGPSLEAEGGELANLGRRRRVMLLRQRAQMVFQDPYESLNPRQKVFSIVSEPLEVHRLARSRREKEERVRAALEACGLAPADHFWGRYPDELSGGQRQRVVIAGALVLEPTLLMADEPVSMLDVSIRAEILNLLHTLRKGRGITILYATHDLEGARTLCSRVAVMDRGRAMLAPVAILSSSWLMLCSRTRWAACRSSFSRMSFFKSSRFLYLSLMSWASSSLISGSCFSFTLLSLTLMESLRPASSLTSKSAG